MNRLTKARTSLKDATVRVIGTTKDSVAAFVENVQVTETITETIRLWVVSLFVKGVDSCSTERDRAELLAWLASVRLELVRNQSPGEKFQAIAKSIDGKKTASAISRSVGEAFGNYKNSKLPLPMKVAIPVTVSAATVLGGAGVGIVGFGTGIGVSALLLVFLGVAGVTSVIEAVAVGKGSVEYVAFIGAMIAHDEVLRRTNAELQKMMMQSPIPPRRSNFPNDTPDNASALQQDLLNLAPNEFEQHVMSFFHNAGLTAWVTKKSNDAGVDGFARHGSGLIVVQCKRNAPDNSVGRPIVQQFKGVVEENNAWRGYIVTTSYFTSEAHESAQKNEKLILVDMPVLADWHTQGFQAR